MKYVFGNKKKMKNRFLTKVRKNDRDKSKYHWKRSERTSYGANQDWCCNVLYEGGS